MRATPGTMATSLARSLAVSAARSPQRTRLPTSTAAQVRHSSFTSVEENPLETVDDWTNLQHPRPHNHGSRHLLDSEYGSTQTRAGQHLPASPFPPPTRSPLRHHPLRSHRFRGPFRPLAEAHEPQLCAPRIRRPRRHHHHRPHETRQHTRAMVRTYHFSRSPLSPQVLLFGPCLEHADLAPTSFCALVRSTPLANVSRATVHQRATSPRLVSQPLAAPSAKVRTASLPHTITGQPLHRAPPEGVYRMPARDCVDRTRSALADLDCA